MYSNDLARPIFILNNFLKTSAISLAIVVLPTFGLSGIVFADTVADSPPINQFTDPADPASDQIPTVQPASTEESITISLAAQTPIANSLPTSDPPTVNKSIEIGVTNELNSSSISGNTTALNNAEVGTISTGEATASTTNLNLVNSSIGLPNGSKPLTFNYDISGNVAGDLLIDPSQLVAAESLQISNLDLTPISIGADTNTTIINDFALTAISGDATATNNSSTADILTGDANAVANVVNIINSAINANKSFIGMINIFGNFEGNIVLSQDLVSELLGASQLGPYQIMGTETELNIDQNFSIINNINSLAHSGSAKVSDNNQTGDVSSGTSKTSVTLQNIANFGVTSKNMLLIFINVLGSWLGLLFDSPAGTTSAIVGDSSEEANISSGQNSLISTPYSYLSSQTNTTIVNNINLVARSGDATVTENFKTGNISTGNATTSANILNVISSRLNLSNWFGILFINVFGKWHGNIMFAPQINDYKKDSSMAEQNISKAPEEAFSFIAKKNARNHAIKSSPTIIKNSADSSTNFPINTIHSVSKNLLGITKDNRGSSNQSLLSFWIIISFMTISTAIGARYYLATRIRI